MDPVTVRFGIEAGELEGRVTTQELFGNGRPLEIEVGAGKGTFLVEQSRRRPDVNFLGIEYARRYWSYAADRLQRADLVNARVVLGEACQIIQTHFGENELSAVHIHFPDPWPKTRHRKRRLVQPHFVDLISERMKPGGRLQIVTDHEDYFRQIQQVVSSSTLVRAPFEGLDGAKEDELVGSNFERKYRKEGRAIYSIAATKA